VKLLILQRAPGKPAARKVIEGDWLRVGRNASCEIHLPDPRIALEQGLIVNRDGPVYVEGEGGSQNITRKAVHAVRMKPGQSVDIGPYRLEAVAAPAGFDGAITIHRLAAAEPEAATAGRTSRRTLESVGLGKRPIAWALFALVLAAFLVLPMGRVLDLPWRQAAAHLPLGDRFWNPGPLTLAHEPIAGDCGACHEVAFNHVKNGACLECHSTIGSHASTDLRQAALPAEARCTSCHREHKGVKPTHRDDAGFCVDCHRDVKAAAATAESSNVSDFARDHPAFRVTIAGARIREGTAPLRQSPGLAFNHAVHLDAKGVKHPAKGRVKLDCGACHHPDASRRAFEPVSMRRDCRECHGLQFEPAVTAREAPHGDPREAAQAIDEFYASLALRGTPDSFQKAFGVPGEGLLRRVAEPAEGERRNALAMAEQKSRRVARDLFEVRVCKTCHAVKAAGDGWSIAPVKLQRRWMPHARFDHRTHAQAECVKCHDVRASKSSSDVAMPARETCRECHGGQRPAQGKVTSSCLLCHDFHDREHRWDPRFVPRKPAPRVAEVNADAR
jgi:predicted CXXCH cytochrome family protein